MESKLQQPKEKFKVRCFTCNKDVEVTLTSYGKGWVAICPECNKLAYNSTVKPTSV